MTLISKILSFKTAIIGVSTLVATVVAFSNSSEGVVIPEKVDAKEKAIVCYAGLPMHSRLCR